MSKTPFVVIGKGDGESITLHRYVGKIHSGILQFNVAEVNNSTEINNLANEYRVKGNSIYRDNDTSFENIDNDSQ